MPCQLHYKLNMMSWMFYADVNQFHHFIYPIMEFGHQTVAYLVYFLCLNGSYSLVKLKFNRENNAFLFHNVFSEWCEDYRNEYIPTEELQRRVDKFFDVFDARKLQANE